MSDREDGFNFTADVEDLLRRAFLEFAQWMSANWTTTPEEAETLTDPTDHPADYARGYNDAIRQIGDAAETWIDGGYS